MDAFNINLNSIKQEFHRYSTDDFALLEIGIGSYNKSSLAKFFKLDPTSLVAQGPADPDVIEFFSGGGKTVVNDLLGFSLAGSMSIMDFDVDDKLFREVVGFNQIVSLDPQKYPPKDFAQPEADISMFVTNWDNIQKGFETDTKVINGYQAVVYKIQNSLSGCITFDVSLTILGTPRTSKIQLSFLESADYTSSRTMSFNGSPFITAPGRTSYGATYSFGATNAAPIGAIVSPGSNRNNPQDSVAGELDLAYDPSTGKWASGTQQILAKLLDNIDSANNLEIEPESFETMTRAEFYDSGPESDAFMGNLTKGRAVPLSAENGNPYMFGPDFKDGCEGANKVIITVRNRLNQSYKAGQIVVVSRMLGENGEWVIVSPGTPGGTKTKKAFFGNFEYQQYFIPANYYFGAPNSPEKLLPNVWISKLRDDYYYRLFRRHRLIDSARHARYRRNDIDLLKQINLYASGFDETVVDPIKQMHEIIYGSTTIKIDPYNSSTIFRNLENGGFERIEAFQFMYEILSTFLVQAYVPYNKEYEKEISYPKNILKRTVISGRDTNSRWNSPDPIGSLAVPIFWGMLFPDGYKSGQANRYKNLVKENPILNNDPNFAELSVAGTICVPDLGSTLESLLFMRQFMSRDYALLTKTVSPDVIRKTGGNFVYNTTFSQEIDAFIEPSFDHLYDRVSLNNVGNFNNYGIEALPRLLNDDEITKLEPVNPAKIQFSSLSLEALYMLSELNAPGFADIKKLVDLYKDVQYDSYLLKLQDYAKKIIFNLNQEVENVQGAFINEIGNKYNINSLAYSNSFNPIGQTVINNPAPLGTLMAGGFIIPTFEGSPRLPLMPVLTCKSKIRTSAESLLFTIDENIGIIRKKVATPGSVSIPVSVPLFPPILLPGIEGNIEPSVVATPQWGGGNDIDSFGTTALHVQIYEGFPINQVIYFGQIFTPLHFNPSSPDKISVLNYTDDGKINIQDTERYSISSVDFRVPTYKIPDTTINFGEEIPLGTFFDFPEPKDEAGKGLWNLAPQSEWRISTIRRAKLLSGGGFFYLKPVFAISSVSPIPKSGGTNYVEGETFTYSDGSKLTIKEIGKDGAITKVEFTSNIIEPDMGDGFKQQNSDTIGYTTPSNVVPQYNGQNGSGASFDIKQFKLIDSIGYDRPPKSTQIIRLTSPNNGGKSDARIGTIQRTIDLPQTDKKEYDIFYFYHNDPSHYPLNEYLPYNQGFAQHVISEITPQ